MKPTAIHRCPAVSCITRDVVRRGVECASQQYLRPKCGAFCIPRLPVWYTSPHSRLHVRRVNLGAIAHTWNIFRLVIDCPAINFVATGTPGHRCTKKEFRIRLQNTQENASRNEGGHF